MTNLRESLQTGEKVWAYNRYIPCASPRSELITVRLPRPNKPTITDMAGVQVEITTGIAVEDAESEKTLDMPRVEGVYAQAITE